ncbi:MAG: SDR family oxidoreductase [Verrucomicrobiae bacterium]|nr:SDR family oxidoreductase [Verrucomicrobiae bacterium]
MNILEQFSLKGKVALLTGGTGLYGRQILEALVEAGAKTCIASRNAKNLNATLAEYQNKGRTLEILCYDQGDESSILALRNELRQRVQRLDVLVNNAVLRPMLNKGCQDEAAAFAESMRVNATGLFVITRAFGDWMAEEGGGSIVNMGSIHGLIAPDAALYRNTNISGWYPDYFFHKGGMINFTRFIASYYGGKGVRCNCINPGGFQTEKMSETFVRQYCDRTLLGRMASQTDLKGAVIFLASEASAYITGANIPVDGGYTAK